MKPLNSHFHLLIFCTMVVYSCNNKMNPTTKIFKQNDNIVVAHRGAWKNLQLPENSIASLRHAIDLGCAGTEFDVHMTADDSLVINHDPKHHGIDIENHTYADLIQYPLANGELLPTLRQYLQAGMKNNTGTQLVIEIKPTAKGKDRADFIINKAYALVHQLRLQSKVAFISFDLDMLLTLISLDKNVNTQYLNGELSPDQITDLHISGIDYNHAVFRQHPEWIAQAKQNKLILNVWTVNNPTDQQYFKDEGFNFITTNEPEQLFQFIKK